MANLTGLASIVSELRAVRTNLVNELRHVDAALSVLGKMSLAQKARWAKRKGKDQADKMRPKRTMSASARGKIAAAQRARWAKVRAKKAA